VITFACSHCGTNFRARDEFIGYSTRCPTCKQRLTVPLADPAEGAVPSDSIDGPLSSVAQAGIVGGVTLAPGSSSNPGT
jgi:hypothetical protein